MAKRNHRMLPLSDADQRLLEARLERFHGEERPARARLWRYYSNPMLPLSVGDSQTARPYRMGQEWGMPARVTGYLPGWEAGAPRPATSLRKDVVVENDIGWRIDTMVDYLFGRPVVLQSQGPVRRREEIEAVLAAVIEGSGGLLLFQQMALLGAVYGFVDVLVTLDPAQQALRAGSAAKPADAAATPRTPEALASLLRVQVVDPMRSLALTEEEDYRRLRLHAQSYTVSRPAAREARGGGARGGGEREQVVQRLDVITANRWLRYEDGVVVSGGGNALGRIPVVHIQNTPLPFSYAGGSDVEPLIPLQDDLNTRLSDRAYRIAMTSMKMYLARQVEGFIENPPMPGRVWASGNADAGITEVGGDAPAPNELAHIADVREALDKTSGVSPVAAGAVKGKIGHLTSAAALRITLMSLLARTDRKRVVYGNGLAQICELSLAWLDLLGVFPTRPEERQIEISWPSALPENVGEKLDEAKAKLEVGIAPQQVLRELGYGSKQDLSRVD